MTGKQSASPRTLVLGGVLVVAILIGLFVFLRGGTTSTPAHAAKLGKHAGVQVDRHAHRQARHHTAGRALQHLQHRHLGRHLTRHAHRRASAKQHGKRQANRPLHHTAQHNYAVSILPVLDTTTRVFDRASHATAGVTDYSELGTVCQQYNLQVQILESQFNGIPHAMPWYSKVGTMHHWIAGVYHYMQGALQQCQTSVANQDYGSVAVAQSDIASATVMMHQKDSYVRWLTHQR